MKGTGKQFEDCGDVRRAVTRVLDWTKGMRALGVVVVIIS